jgi:hypothetical protein
MGAPYALSSDLVSAWPAKSLEVAQYIDGQLPLIAMTQNAQTGTTYTLAATDFTRLVTLSNASPVAVTVPLQSSVAWVAGTQLRLMNLGAGVVTVAGAVGVTINGNVSLKQYQGGTLIRTASDVWAFLPNAASPTSAVANVDTSETSTSTSYTDLATPGPAVTLNTGTKALVIIQSRMYVAAGSTDVFASYAVSGATTIAAGNSRAIALGASGVNLPAIGVSAASLLTGLTAGSNTFTMKYRVSGSTGNWDRRWLSVIDMGS